MLTAENFRKGLLIDEEMMGGVAEDGDQPGHFLAFVLSVPTGEYLGVHRYPALEPALAAMNRIPRKWAYERSSGCGGGKCGEGGCGTAGKCQGGACATGSCPT
jgi:hypothetical protein